MSFPGKVQISVALAAGLLLSWQLARHHGQSRELAALQAQIQAESQKLEARRATFAAIEQRNAEVEEAERRAGNETLLSLMRERAAAAADAKSTSQMHSVSSAFASILDNPDQQALDREAMRNQMRSGMGLFFKLVKLSPEKIDQYVDLGIEKDSRDAKRISALLQGKIAVADALRERDDDAQELEGQQRALLGPEGAAFLDSIADGMRNDEAKRLVNGIQQVMGGNSLTQEQLSRLQGLIKTQLVTLPGDNIDLFRPPEELAQLIRERQQNILTAAADFLSPAQLSTLSILAEADLTQRQAQLMLKRKSLGIK